MCDVRPGLADIAPHLAHYANVIVAVEQVVLVLARPGPPASTVRRLVRLQRRIAEDDDQALCVLVVSRDRDMLLGD